MPLRDSRRRRSGVSRAGRDAPELAAGGSDLEEAREPETVARAGAAKAALEPAKFALAPRTARTAATEEVVRAAIFDEEVNVCGSCAGMPPAEADGAA